MSGIFSTSPIQKQRQRLLKKTRLIIEDFKNLENSLEYLSLNQATINANIEKYIRLLSNANLQFLIGDGRENGVLEKLIIDAQRDFAQSMKDFNIAKYKQRGQKLIEGIKAEYTTTSLSFYERMKAALLNRSQSFKIMSEAAKIPVAALDEINRREILTVYRQADGLPIHYKRGQIKDLWETLSDRYGRYDTVNYGYRQGKNINFPLRSWVDMRSRTTSQEVHRLTTTTEATVNQIYTGRISSHGSKDSCLFHENRIVFFSSIAKELFLQEHPQFSEAQSWPTVQEVTADETHIFKPNCRHVVTAYPFYLFDKKDAQAEIESNPAVNIPEQPEKAAQRIIKKQAAA